MIQNVLSNSAEGVLHTHQYLSPKLKLKDGENPLEFGVFATDPEIIHNYLENKVSSILPLPTALPPMAFPEKNFKKRYG